MRVVEAVEGAIVGLAGPGTVAAAVPVPAPEDEVGVRSARSCVEAPSSGFSSPRSKGNQ